MKILLIDTCGSSGSIALAETDVPPGVISTEGLPGRTASERLVPAINAITERCGLTLRELGAVVVVHGPGSFTGVRVALSAAKGLCEVLGLPLVAISRLAVVADLGRRSLASLSSEGTTVCAVLDAGRGEFYLGEYAGRVCAGETLTARDGVERAAGRGEGVVVVCEPAVAASLAGLRPLLVSEPDAAAALPLALGRIAEGWFDDVATIDANYVRRTDAEIFAKPTAAGVPGAPAAGPDKTVV
jgi:tRNA threonylcarbamoyladenosine biosynthesis protein TsaB